MERMEYGHAAARSAKFHGRLHRRRAPRPFWRQKVHRVAAAEIDQAGRDHLVRRMLSTCGIAAPPVRYGRTTLHRISLGENLVTFSISPLTRHTTRAILIVRPLSNSEECTR